MRTTVTLDDDLFATLQQLARERAVSFKALLNATLRSGLRPEAGERPPYVMPTRALGMRPDIDLDKALRLAADDEDAEIVRKLHLRK